MMKLLTLSRALSTGFDMSDWVGLFELVIMSPKVNTNTCKS